MNALLRIQLENNLEKWQPWTPNRYVMYEYLLHYPQDSDGWHEARKYTLGSSQAGSVLGISTTFTTADLMRKLRGQAQPKPSEYLLGLFAEGNKAEPVLRTELAYILECEIVETGIFVAGCDIPGVHGLSASLDGIAYKVDSEGNIKVILTEFKHRRGERCGWGPGRDELGKTVWCQVQHQMLVANTKGALVYSGSGCGERRLWLVRRAHDDYFTLWRNWLKKRVEQAADNKVTRTPSALKRQLEKDLDLLMLQTVVPLLVLSEPPLPPSHYQNGSPQQH